jgi:uncharacterized protein (TIGR02246 family)
MTNERVEDGVADFLRCLRTAWDAGDAQAFATLFTEDATYVTWLGDAPIDAL